MSWAAELEKKLAMLPDAPGVYRFFDAAGATLYIGKAVSLKKRVRSYFRGQPDRAKTALLISRIVDLEVIVCTSEIEALLLENILIKQHRPPFNIDLKDDKHYPYVRLDLREEFPRFEIVRRRRADGARYFGPFPAVAALRSTLKILNRHFRLRRCSGRRFRNRVRPCLNQQMGLCSGPCCGLIDAAAYRQAVAAAAAILAGRGRPVLARLEKEMAAAAERLDFEAAAAKRDAIADLKTVLAAQEIDAGRDEDLDVIATAGGEAGDAVVYRLTIRGGNVVGGRPFHFRNYGGRLEDLPGAFLQGCYGARAAADELPPPLIVAPAFGEAAAALERWLTELRGGRVRLLVPRRGRKFQLLKLAGKNATEFLERESRAAAFPARALAELARVLKLPAPPAVIEGLDISHLGKEGVVASLVLFRDGRPAPGEYRRYCLEAPPPDDFARMAEVVRRRFAPPAAENGVDAREEGGVAGGRPQPDLLLLDGGRPQLLAVQRMLGELGVKVPLLAIAKGRDAVGGRAGRQPDLFYQPGRAGTLPLGESAPARRLLQQVRDEAHRFPLAYHRRRRSRSRETVLLGIEGIGRKRALQLLEVFGSVEKIAVANLEELTERGRLPSAVAGRVAEFFNRKESG